MALQYAPINFNNEYNNQMRPGHFFDQQDLSSDIKKPIMKKKEIVESFRGGGGGHGSSGMGAGMHGGGHSSAMTGNMSHSGSHHGAYTGWGNNHHGAYNHHNWYANGSYNNPYFTNPVNYSYYGNDSVPYIEYEYIPPVIQPVVQPVYITNDDDDDEEEIKIETIKNDIKKYKNKKNKDKKKKVVIKEKDIKKNKKDEVDKKTLWNIITIMSIIIFIFIIKAFIDYKLIKF